MTNMFYSYQEMRYYLSLNKKVELSIGRYRILAQHFNHNSCKYVIVASMVGGSWYING